MEQAPHHRFTCLLENLLALLPWFAVHRIAAAPHRFAFRLAALPCLRISPRPSGALHRTSVAVSCSTLRPAPRRSKSVASHLVPHCLTTRRILFVARLAASAPRDRSSHSNQNPPLVSPLPLHRLWRFLTNTLVATPFSLAPEWCHTCDHMSAWPRKTQRIP
jgi:hypothetical protein